jgi:hypothetical protein
MLLCFGLAALALAADLSVELLTAYAWSGVAASPLLPFSNPTRIAQCGRQLGWSRREFLDSVIG